MKKLLFIQGGGNGGYEADKKLVDSLKNPAERILDDRVLLIYGIRPLNNID